MIVLKNVLRSYYRFNQEPFYAIRDISLTIEDKKMTAIIGKSGSGKTTLLNVISTMDSPQEGSLLIDGVEYASSYPTNQGEWRQANAGLLFQSSNLENSLTVLENVAFPLMLTGVRAHERKKRAMALLVRFHLEKLRHRHPTRLSGGEKQRIALCRALINNPKYLFADEPTGSLDSANGDFVMQTLREEADHGKTVVFVTHNESYASLADKVVMMRDGRIVSETVNAR